MSKTITDEKIKLSIIIDGNQGQKELGELENRIRDLNSQQKELRKEKQLLEKQGLKETERYKAVTAAITENSKAITAAKTRMSELQKEVGLTGLTLGQLQAKAVSLRTVLRGMIPGTENYKNVKAELAQVTERINELNGKATSAKFSIGSMADGFNRYQALALSAVAAFTGVVLSIQKIIDINGKLSDAQADVMKTTGMTKKEVDELTKSFGALQTRTARIDLLKIAEQGGRIGIAKDEIGQFVDVMNKASVALGDSFTGGVEEVANKLGKLKFLFEETKNMSVDQAYNSIGSAINDLGANGVASEANIADFATRIGSLTDVLKPTIRETLALGAAFEESGIESEVSARAYNIFMKQASTESAKFAQVMGITKSQVESLINTNPLEFMMKFSEGLRGMNATETAKTLDFLGINADGANKVIGAMGNNMARFRELIDLSNNSFVSGSSLINEYNVKNTNLAATLDKIKKTVTGWFSSETFTKWLADAANWFSVFIGAAEDADGSISKWRTNLAFTAKLIAVVIASIVSYSAATRVATLVSNGMTVSTGLFNVALKLQTFYLSLQKAALIIYTGVMNAFGITTDKASASLARLNLVSKLSPWGALLAVITAVTVAYIAFGEETKKAATAQETFAKQQKQLSAEVSKQTADTKANLASLISLIKDEEVSMSTRKKAYEDMIKIYPGFNGFLVDEKFNIEGLVAVYDSYIKALDKVAYARQFSKLNEGNIKKQIDAEQKLFNAEKELQDARNNYAKFQRNAKGKYEGRGLDFLEDSNALRLKIESAQKAVTTARKNVEDANNLVDETNNFRTNQIKALQESIIVSEAALAQITDKSSVEFKQAKIKLESEKASLDAIIGKSTPAPGKSTFNAPSGDEGKKSTVKSLEEMNKERLDAEKKFQDELLRLKRQGEDDAIALMQDGYAKEQAVEALRYQREIEDLERQKVRKEEIAKLDESIAKAKADGDTKYYNFLLQQKEEWGKKNQVINDKINEIEAGKLGIHKLRMAAIEQKAATERLQKANEKYEHEKLNRETAYLEELALLGNNEKAKEKLKKDFEAAELEAQKKHLETLLKEQQDLLAGLNQNVDVTLLTPEQKDAFELQVDELRNKIAQLLVEIAKLKGQSTSGTDFSILSGQGTDILGFSPEQWDQVFSNLDTMQEKIQAAQTVIGGLQQVWSIYSGFVEANQARELQALERTEKAKKKRLKQQLDQGLINQHQYKKGIEKIDDDIEKKRAEIEYKKAKRERIATLFSIAANTGLGIMKAVAASPLTGGMPWTAIIAGLGALQAAQVLATPLPAKGYEKGLYPEYVRREQDNKVFRSNGRAPMNQFGLYSKPTILVGEGPGDMPEMIVDKRAMSRINPEVRDAFIREMRGVRGFEKGYYDKAGTYQVPAATAPATSNDQLVVMLMQVVERNTNVMEDLRRNGVIGKFFRNDTKSMRELDEGLKDYYAIRNKSRI